MAFNRELEDTITVNVNVDPIRFSYSGPLGEVYAAIRQRMNKVKRIQDRAGRKIAEKARENQMSSIQSLKAICSGNLYGSIRVNGNGGKYIVGTSSSKKGYIYLIYGRPAIDLTGTQRVMKFRAKCTGKLIETQKVRHAPQKNYMKKAESMTKRDITAIVEEEVNRAMA